MAIHTSQRHMLISQLLPLSVQSHFSIILSLFTDIFSILPRYQPFLSLGHSHFYSTFLGMIFNRCLFNLYSCSHCYITIPALVTIPILHSNSLSIDPSFHDSYHHNAHYTFKFWSYIASFFLLNIKICHISFPIFPLYF